MAFVYCPWLDLHRGGVSFWKLYSTLRFYALGVFGFVRTLVPRSLHMGRSMPFLYWPKLPPAVLGGVDHIYGPVTVALAHKSPVFPKANDKAKVHLRNG